MPSAPPTLPPSVIQLHPADNVAVAAKTLARGQQFTVSAGPITAAGEVRFGHKVALTAISIGQPILKYGQVIGYAVQPISAGEHVHSHNLHLGELHLDYAKASETPPPTTPITGRTFDGYLRADGRAGTRNYIAVISTVNCSASVAKYVAHAFDQRRLADFPNIDGIVPFTHQSGCGMQFGGDAHNTLNRVMAGIARHPNIGGYLLIGLGCETGAMGYLLQREQLIQLDGGAAQPPGAPLVLSMQDQGGTAKTIEAGVARLAEMLPRVNDVRRQPIPASEIVLATECGGSDAYSGVTANPAVGAAADRVVAAGGISILSETSEIYGAEHLLTRRATSVEVADKLIERIEWWKRYVAMFGVELDNNPSPGNKEGGLTTIAEKSLGAVAKAGSTALVDVLQYAEPPTSRGMMVMDTPGYDPASVTGMVAGGANVVVFTTGRGSCFGCKPSPSIKIATNTPMYERMVDDMDINAGEILSGVSVDEMGAKIFEEILAVASGKPTKSEALGIGEEEFVPWLVGPTL
ncbi:UxaA family hydrolase [Blastopirellula marina]|uniref:Galactonate dehydratase n=1 Tax=Blastopirellula marina TaxID=124 RepID=A0A2S8FWB8_9BACT|nr:altronate dehydratase family protein [Blastopirellula marina]PQO36481.1 galactonate dehydratase [Blastopirellula marina]PTL44318.1 altronate dehydratase [Blastopirellula marina]